MRSIKRRFDNFRQKNPNLSTYISFAKTVRGQRFSRYAISKWFNKLVDKDDYSPKDRNQLVRELTKLTEEREN